MANGTATAPPPGTLPDDRVRETGRMAHELLVQRILQPDDVTCGPTCLRKVYQYYGLELELEQVLGEIDRNEDGGTLAVFLGISALRRGFRARLYSYDLRIFDPSWFDLPMPALAEKIHQRIPYLSTAKTVRAAQAYLELLELGGEIRFDELSPSLLKGILDRDHPILAGLSATYLYRWMRERQLEDRDELVPDDVRGEPTRHFILVAGCEQWGRRFSLRDPSAHVPHARDCDGRQVVDAQSLINAILLGDLTYDAVLLEIWPASEEAGEGVA